MTGLRLSPAAGAAGLVLLLATQLAAGAAPASDCLPNQDCRTESTSESSDSNQPEPPGKPSDKPSKNDDSPADQGPEAGENQSPGQAPDPGPPTEDEQVEEAPVDRDSDSGSTRSGTEQDPPPATDDASTNSTAPSGGTSTTEASPRRPAAGLGVESGEESVAPLPPSPVDLGPLRDFRVTVSPDGGQREQLSIAVEEQRVPGADAGWMVFVEASGARLVPGRLLTESQSQHRGVAVGLENPRTLDGPLALFTVLGQRSSQRYQARYEAAARLDLPDTSPPDTITVTLLQ